MKHSQNRIIEERENTHKILIYLKKKENTHKIKLHKEKKHSQNRI